MVIKKIKLSLSVHPFSYSQNPEVTSVSLYSFEKCNVCMDTITSRSLYFSLFYYEVINFIVYFMSKLMKQSMYDVCKLK